MSADVFSKGFSDLAVKFILETTSNEWKREGCISPIGIILATRDTEGRYFEKPQFVLVPALFRNDTDKDLFSTVMRKLAKDLDAVGTAMVSEAWHVTLELSELGESLKDASERFRKDNPGGVKSRPDRKEVVQVLWQHCTFKYHEVWKSEIQRERPGDESSPGVLLDWKLTKDSVSGRMANFLPGSGGN